MSRTKKDTIDISPIHEKLYADKFRPDISSHIKVNQDACLICEKKECTKFCPSRVFIFSEIDEKLYITYENCLECGICTSGCPYHAIEYRHPNGGYGVVI